MHCGAFFIAENNEIETEKRLRVHENV